MFGEFFQDLTLSCWQRKKIGEKIKKMAFARRPPTNRIAIFSGNTLRPVIKIDRLHCHRCRLLLSLSVAPSPSSSTLLPIVPSPSTSLSLSSATIIVVRCHLRRHHRGTPLPVTLLPSLPSLSSLSSYYCCHRAIVVVVVFIVVVVVTHHHRHHRCIPSHRCPLRCCYHHRRRHCCRRPSERNFPGTVPGGFRVCPEAIFFEHKNTKTHLSHLKKG